MKHYLITSTCSQTFQKRILCASVEPGDADNWAGKSILSWESHESLTGSIGHAFPWNPIFLVIGQIEVVQNFQKENYPTPHYYSMIHAAKRETWHKVLNSWRVKDIMYEEFDLFQTPKLF